MAEFSSKKITQETFDEVVKENMEEFDMGLEEALKDAVSQFQTQGVDLSSVDTTGNPESAELQKQLISNLDIIKNAENSMEQLEASLNALKELFKTDDEQGDLIRSLATQHKGHQALCELLQAKADVFPLVPPVLQALTALCRHEEAKRGLYGDQVGALVAAADRALAAGAAAAGEEGEEGEGAAWGAAARGALLAARLLCQKCEDNKVWFVKKGGGASLRRAVELGGAGAGRRRLLRAACQALQPLVVADDLTTDFSAAFDHARDLVGKGLIPAILGAVRAFPEDYEVISAALLAVRGLAANNDAVQEILQHGGNELAGGVLGHPSADAAARAACLALVRNTCADDGQKAAVAEGEILPMIISAMKAHPANSQLQEHGAAALAQVALRSPEHGARLVAAGAARAVTTAMRRHPAATAVQRQGALCIRNIVARSPQFIETFLEEGAEPLLRAAGRYQNSVDEAYGALRDLRCEVSLVQVSADGAVVGGAVEVFGVRSSAFKPVYDDAPDAEARVAEAAQAPAATMNM